MRNPLDQIESRLQAWIENSLTLFSGAAPALPLAHHLVQTLQDNLHEDDAGQLIAPNRFVILMHPETLRTWGEVPGRLESLAAVLHESAINAGIHFSAPLTISALPGTSLAREEFEIQAEITDSEEGHTAAVTLSPASQARPTQDNLPSGAFLILYGDQVFPLNSAVINLGRRSDNQVVIDDPRVSRSHAQLRAVRKQYILFDLNSTGGTYVNGRRIVQEPLKPGDVISLAGVPIIYGQEHNEPSAEMGDTSVIFTNPEVNE